MKRLEIIVNGTAYPCMPTMGAMARFEDMTGRDFASLRPSHVSDLLRYLWCCVCAASNREGKEFVLSFLDFADSITPDDMAEWSAAITAAAADTGGTGEEKKSL